MRTTPTVSVVIATRNYARFLAGAIDSVRRQTFADWELLVIDDGSTDATPAVLARFAGDARIRAIRTDGAGQPRAKNLGAGLARGRYVAFLDGDDAWLPTKLERQVRLMQACPRVGVVTCPRVAIGEDGGILPTPPDDSPRGDFLARLMRGNPVCFSSVMLRREVLDRLGPFDPRIDMAIDYDLWLKVSPHYAFDSVDEPLVQYRTGHANLSRRLLDRVDVNRAIQRQHLDRRGLRSRLAPADARDTWHRSFASMGYVYRDSDLRASLSWYGKALATGCRVPTTLKRVAGSLTAWAGRRLGAKPGALAAENRVENR